jgi:hypothetical protein
MACCDLSEVLSIIALELDQSNPSKWLACGCHIVTFCKDVKQNTRPHDFITEMYSNLPINI